MVKMECLLRSVKNAFVSGSFSVISVRTISNLFVHTESYALYTKDAASSVQSSDVLQYFGSSFHEQSIFAVVTG